MLRLLLVCALAARALSQCPPPPPLPPSQPDCCSSGCCSSGDGSDNNTCLSVSTIDVSVADLAQMQPLVYTFVPMSAVYYQVDNICVTMFPVNNGSNTMIAYESQVYCDGSFRILTYIVKSNGTGTIVWGNADRMFSDRYMDFADCGTYVVYRCGDCGDAPGPPTVLGMAPASNSSLSIACVRQALDIASALGVPTDDNVYVFPQKLPTNCVLQQRCQPETSPIYCQQGGSCMPY